MYRRAIPVGAMLLGACFASANGPMDEAVARHTRVYGGQQQPADVECVDFEVDAPCYFKDTNPLRDFYAGQGIHFEGPNVLDGGAILDECANFGFGPRSGSRYFGFNPKAQMLNGGLAGDPETVRFDSVASAVSVWVSGGANLARFQMDAYDGAGGLLGSVTVNTERELWSELALNVSGIRSVVIDELLQAPYFVWDDFCVTFGMAEDCLELSVSPLVAGGSAVWEVRGATVNAEVAVVYGHNPGSTTLNGYAGYCADFGIQGVNQSRVLCRKTADVAGEISCRKGIPERDQRGACFVAGSGAKYVSGCLYVES